MSHLCILIADDHTILREGMRALARAQSDIRVVGEASTGREAVQQAQRLRPDVVVMDLVMPELDGIAATEHIRSAHPATQVVILSAHATSEHIFRAFKAGALGYVLKESAGREVMDAIRAVHLRQRYLSSRIADIVTADFVRLRDRSDGRSPLESLSDREREVMRSVIDGQTSAGIAARLGVSAKTVDTYRRRIMDKLGVRDLGGLIRFAIQHGLLPG